MCVLVRVVISGSKTVTSSSHFKSNCTGHFLRVMFASFNLHSDSVFIRTYILYLLTPNLIGERISEYHILHCLLRIFQFIR